MTSERRELRRLLAEVWTTWSRAQPRSQKIREAVLENQPAPAQLTFPEIEKALQAALKAADDQLSQSLKDYQKTAAKKTCPRCKGKGVLPLERVVYAGISGGCYQCNAEGQLAADSKAAAKHYREAQLEALRASWRAVSQAIQRATPLLDLPHGQKPLALPYVIKRWNNLLAGYEAQAKQLKSQK